MPHPAFGGAPGYATSLSAVSTGTGTAVAVNHLRQASWYIVGAGTVSGGVVKIETAHASDFTGTWSELDSLDFGVDALTNKTYWQTSPGHLLFVRGRVSSNVTGGGTISVLFTGLAD